MKKFLLFILLSIISCSKDENQISQPVVNNIYFPSIDSDQWETISPDELNWDSVEIENLYEFLELNNTRAFVVLKDGKIVIENYWGNNILNTAPFDRNSSWYWASAGKTLTALMVGIAQEDGLLSIEDSSAIYLGNGWTNLTAEQEGLIKIKHQFNYLNEAPSIYDFLIEVFNNNFVLGSKNKLNKESRILLLQWKDTIQFRDSFQQVSEKISKDLDVESEGKDLMDDDHTMSLLMDVLQTVGVPLADASAFTVSMIKNRPIMPTQFGHLTLLLSSRCTDKAIWSAHRMVVEEN